MFGSIENLTAQVKWPPCSVWRSMNVTTVRSERSASQMREKRGMNRVTGFMSGNDECACSSSHEMCTVWPAGGAKEPTAACRYRADAGSATRDDVIFEPAFHSPQGSWGLSAHHCLELHTKWNQQYILGRKLYSCIVSLRIAMTDIWSSMENI